jgi:hypothetical protein
VGLRRGGADAAPAELPQAPCECWIVLAPKWMAGLSATRAAFTRKASVAAMIPTASSGLNARIRERKRRSGISVVLGGRRPIKVDRSQFFGLLCNGSETDGRGPVSTEQSPEDYSATVTVGTGTRPGTLPQVRIAATN